MRISDWSSDVCSSDLAVAPAALGLIERTVCCTEQLQRRRRGLRIERSHAKADGQADALTVAVELKPLDILPHPLGQQHRLRPAGCRQRDDELLTTVTRREITGSLAMLLANRRALAQAIVADRMAVAGVD